jgi:hypothetical protein
LAGSLSANEKVVPTGGLRLRENVARRLPALQVRWDWCALLITGGVLAGPVLVVVVFSCTVALNRSRYPLRLTFGAAVDPSARAGW